MAKKHNSLADAAKEERPPTTPQRWLDKLGVENSSKMLQWIDEWEAGAARDKFPTRIHLCRFLVRHFRLNVTAQTIQRFIRNRECQA